MKQTIGIVGCGVVGSALARSYLEWCEVRVYDVEPVRRSHTLDQVLKSDFVFVCLPTPQQNEGMAHDLSSVDGFFAEHRGCQANLVLRSTVPPGTTRRLREQYDLPNLVHSPEFLTARCSFVDAQTPARNIIGGDYSGTCGHMLYSLYRWRFPCVPVLLMSSDESELVKLVVNTFFAVKVSFFNEANWLCHKLGLSWNTVLGGVLSDGRIAHAHTSVPGHDGFGFSGSCLPKDLAAFIALAEQQGQMPAVSKGAHQRNQWDRQRPDLPACNAPVASVKMVTRPVFPITGEE